MNKGVTKKFRVYFYDEETGDTVACPKDYEIVRIGRRQYLFQKEDVAYDVDLEESTCTCPHYMIRGGGKRGCKHLRLARLIEAKTPS
jgi:hypothetical protein